MAHFEQHDLGTFIRGSTYEGPGIRPLINGVVKDLTGATIDIVFRRNTATGEIEKSISETDGITVSSPASLGYFTIDDFDIDYVSGKLYYDCKIIYSDGKTKYWIWGYLYIKENSTNE